MKKRSFMIVLVCTCAAFALTACKTPFSSGESSSSKIVTETTTEAVQTTGTEAVTKYIIPQLLGRTEDEVKKELSGVRIAVMHAYDEDYPAGQIFKANVKEGDAIYTGQDMTIYISLGHNYGNDVIGMDGEEARAYLESHGVQVGYVSEGNPTNDPALVGKVYECSFMGEKALLDVYSDGVPEGAAEAFSEQNTDGQTGEETTEPTSGQTEEQTTVQQEEPANNPAE